jgi:hypothetical protein
MSLNSAQRRVYLKEKKSSDRALSIAATCQAATATIVDQSDSREERPVDRATRCRNYKREPVPSPYFPTPLRPHTSPFSLRPAYHRLPQPPLSPF